MRVNPHMSDTVTATLAREPACSAQARRVLTEHFAERVSREALDDARTVISELVSNAYVHGRGQIEVRLALRDGRLRIEVVDEGQGAAVQVRRAGELGGGHGLQIVQALSDRWGAHEGTTHVWAELETA